MYFSIPFFFFSLSLAPRLNFSLALFDLFIFIAIKCVCTRLTSIYIFSTVMYVYYAACSTVRHEADLWCLFVIQYGMRHISFVCSFVRLGVCDPHSYERLFFDGNGAMMQGGMLLYYCHHYHCLRYLCFLSLKFFHLYRFAINDDDDDDTL